MGKPTLNIKEPPESQRRPATSGPARVQADELFGGRREIVIEHAGAQYRLRITRANKLILTK